MNFKSEKCNSRKENKQQEKKSKDFKKRIDLHEYSKSHNAPSVQKKINETNGKDLSILPTDTADCDLKTLKTNLNPDSSMLEIEFYKLRSTLRCELDNSVKNICCIISMIAGFHIRNRTNLFHLLSAIKKFVLSVEFLLMRTINQFRQNIPTFEIENVANVKSNVFEPTDIDTKYIFNDLLKNELGKINTVDHLKTYNDSKVSVGVGYRSWRTGIQRYRMHVVLMEYFQSALRESVRIQVQLATTNIDSPDSRIPLSMPIYMHGFIYRKDNLR